jgi:hypothetical protein
MIRATAGLLTGMLLTLATQAADAQVELAGRRAMVTATGSATIELSPERLRVKFRSHGEGAAIKDAFAALRKQADKDKAFLRSLEADPESIRTGVPKVQSASEASQQKQMLNVLMQNGGFGGGMGGGGFFQVAEAIEVAPAGKADKDGLRKFVTSAEISAEWPSKTQGVEELWVQREELSDKLKQRDVGGFLRINGLTAEQLDGIQVQLDENMMGMGFEQVYAGAQFSFVAAIPKQRRLLAMKQAFRNAKQNAEEIAASADRSLGPLLTVGAIDQTEYIMAQYAFAYGQQNDENTNSQHEISAPSPGPLKRVLTTSVSFQLADE